jgi:preprotein translocase subunit SecG
LRKVVEILSYAFILIAMSYLGRRPLTVIFIISASIVCLIIGIMLNFDDDNGDGLQTIRSGSNQFLKTAYQGLEFLGKFLISAAFG